MFYMKHANWINWLFKIIKVFLIELNSLCAFYQPEVWHAHFSTVTKSTTVLDCKTALVGEFNIHVFDPNNKESKVFLNMLEAAGLNQLVFSSALPKLLYTSTCTQ